LGNLFTFIQYRTYDIWPGPVFQREFNGGVYFVTRLTIFGNFIVLYECICIIHHFSVWIQLWHWLCHPETIFWKYMIWPSSGIIFRWEFSCDCDYVIWRLYFENIWYGHHQASFFHANSVVTVIMSSKDYILKIYDMAIIKHHFSMQIQLWQWLFHPNTIFWKYMIWPSLSIIFPCKFSCDSDYVIRRLYFENIWYGHHQASFFHVNSVVTVIISLGDYIWKIYDMVITRHHFLFHI